MQRKLWLILGISLFLIAIFPNVSASSVSRSFKDAVAPNEVFRVSLNVDLTKGEKYYLVDEIYPKEFKEISEDSFGTFDGNGHVKWAFITGAGSTILSYTLQAPSVAGNYDFKGGQYIFEGQSEASDIEGQITIKIDPSLITNMDCFDKCENDILYQKGAFDRNLGCIYVIQTPCKYGCLHTKSTDMSANPACNKVPDTPPPSGTPEYDETVWNMVKNLWDKENNKPNSIIQVHGTEYAQGDSGRIFIQLITADMASTINNATCFLNAYRPDNAIFLSNISMTALGTDGIYYYDTPTLANLGVYVVSVWCAIPQMSPNFTTTLYYSDSFTTQNECGGTGFSGNWNFVGNLIYDSLRDEPGINHAPPDNFVSLAGSFGSSYQLGASILIKSSPNATFNKIEWDLNAITGTPQSKNYIYNLSICPTTVDNLTANATFGADCSSAPILLSTNNLSCSFGSQAYGNLLSTNFLNFVSNSSLRYILNLQYVSGNVSDGNNFWTMKGKSPPAPPNSQYYRRVLNTSVASTFTTLMDYQTLNTPVSIITSSDCYSGTCILLNGTTGYAERVLDASSATSLNLSIRTKVQDLVIGSKASVRFWDGTWKTIFEWTHGQEHNWTLYNITLDAIDYHFLPNNMIGFFLELSGSPDPNNVFYLDDLNIYKTGVSYYFLNGTQYQIGRGSSEVHVSQNNSDLTFGIWNYTNRTLTDFNFTVNVNQSQLDPIINYLIQINGTTFNINNSEYNSLLSAINSVNATSNQSLSFLVAINGSVFQINNTLNSQFAQVIALLNQINYSLNTTLEYKLDLINGTVFQINDSQYSNYISLLGAINSVNLTANTTLVNYLVYINGTTFQINQSLFNDYTNLLNAINSINSSINNTVIPYLIGINGTTYNINQQIPLIIQYLNDINITTNSTIPASLISINNTQNANFATIMNFLASINYTGNTTLELKLDQINTTVVQINNTVNNLSTDFSPVLNAINSVNSTLNTTVLNLLNQINTTTIQNQNYLMVINGTVFQINDSILGIINQMNNLNTSQNQNYISLYNFLQQINATGNSTLEFVASINTSLLNYYTSLYGAIVSMNSSVMNELLQMNSTININNALLQEINFTTHATENKLDLYYANLIDFLTSINYSINTTMEYKLDLINGTVFSIEGTTNYMNQSLTQALQYLVAINYTTNTTIPTYLISINDTQNTHFVDIMNFLASLNYTSNTTLEYKLDLINETVFQINDSLSNLNVSINLTPILDAIGQVNTTVNQNQNYLVQINGTIFQINQSQAQNFLTIINMLDSMNATINATILNYLVTINATTNELNSTLFIDYTNIINAINSINASMNSSFENMNNFLASINVTINTTMENKLDLINQTVFQINDSLSNLNLTVNLTGLYDALASINGTINSTIINELLLINSNILNHNSSEYQHFLDMSVLLNDINFGINTTMENKLDFINSTTWQTWLLLQNLTIGNVSVTANVNWTEGYINWSFLTFSDNIGGEGITLTSETLICLSNTTLQHMINATQCIQGICHQGNSTITETCLHGCANNMCIPAPQLASLSALGIALIIMGGIYVAYRAWK